ncbi:MAG TPA: hypothetical protein VGI70_04540, partial [Polyangiales bacterium]
MTTGARASFRGPVRAHLDEAQRLIAACGRNTNANDPGSIADAVEAVGARVSDHLEPLIGHRAVEALLARAVYMSKPGFDVLNRVSTAEVNIANVARDVALRLRSAKTANAREVAISVFGNFVWLLTRFIGEDLGLRLLRE